MSREIAYRAGTLADAGLLAEFFAFSFSDTFGHLYPPEDLSAFLSGLDEKGFGGELADPRFAFRLAESDGKLIGYCKLGPPSLPFDPGERRAIELRQLYIAPEFKGAGPGVALMEWAIAHALGGEFEDMYLSVFIDNQRARRFYERYGFVEVGVYGFKVGRVVDDDRVMKLTL